VRKPKVIVSFGSALYIPASKSPNSVFATFARPGWITSTIIYSTKREIRGGEDVCENNGCIPRKIYMEKVGKQETFELGTAPFCRERSTARNKSVR
jgi:hypothetical protein